MTPPEFMHTEPRRGRPMTTVTHTGPDLFDHLAAITDDRTTPDVTHLFTPHMGLWCGADFLTETRRRRALAAAAGHRQETKTGTTAIRETTCPECLSRRATDTRRSTR